MLEAILEKFPGDRKQNFPTLDAVAKKTAEQKCDQCNGNRFWRPFHSREWFCFDCQKPPSMTLVEEMRKPEMRLVRHDGAWVDLRDRDPLDENLESESISEPATVASLVSTTWFQSPVAEICSYCHSHRYIERVFSDGTVEQKCWTCKRAVRD